MKKLFLLSSVLLTLSSCWDMGSTSEPVDATSYTPVIMERTDLEASIKWQPGQSIKNYGKIYRKGNLLFINERYEGIHVIDNADPENPAHIGFITIPGNVDIAMMDNTIYADNATDLVAISYTNNTIEVKSREKSVFPEPTPPDGGYIPAKYAASNRPANTVIVKWEKQ